MEIIEQKDNKKAFLSLLLLADEEEKMVDTYLERGRMFLLFDEGLKAECVITKEGDGVYELKNIATFPEFQRRGYGKRLIHFLFEKFPDCQTLYVGTGDTPATISFYHACGFKESHLIKNFFRDHYSHPIIEDGKLLIDMVYLKRTRPV